VIGHRLGPYEVLAKLGEGGMGVVYSARDTKLGRQVALKVLPPAVASDAEYLSRFEREGRLLAAVNHPNIATLYGVEETSEGTALVMEFVDGRTLADCIAEDGASRGLPIQTAIAVARQIADAMTARTRARHRSPGLETGQYQDRAGRYRQSSGLRPRQGRNRRSGMGLRQR
jgi:serine/threonine protein kinase